MYYSCKLQLKKIKAKSRLKYKIVCIFLCFSRDFFKSTSYFINLTQSSFMVGGTHHLKSIRMSLNTNLALNAPLYVFINGCTLLTTTILSQFILHIYIQFSNSSNQYFSISISFLFFHIFCNLSEELTFQ